uniref:ribonuclease J n=1 Tax=Armatimonas sp. TaxID=1872638 RepID=UPI0037519FC2
RADDISNCKANQITILTTGSQGEPLAGLSRMAAGDHRQVTIQKGDTIVLSSSPIPGNESAVWRVVNKLFALGANVIYDALMPVHVSGHGYSEELKLVLNITNPQYVIPVHGERRMLALYARHAQDMGWLPEDVFVLELGDVLELDTSKGEIVDRIPSGAVLIDGDTGQEIHELVLRDRQFLANDGFLNVVVVLDSESGELIGGPEFLSRGCFYMDSADELLAEAATVVEKLLEDEDSEEESPREPEALQGDIRMALKKFIEKRTGRRPVILTSVMRV